MKAILTAAIAVAFAMPAFAQTQCGPTQEVVAYLVEQYGETIQSHGLTGDAAIVTFANIETGSWSVLVTRPDGVSCLAASGSDFSRYDNDPAPTGDPA